MADSNDNNDLALPSQISWQAQNTANERYRGVAVNPNVADADALVLNGGSAMTKGGAALVSNDISGGALNIYPSSGIAINAPSTCKPQAPLIEVQVLEQEETRTEEESKAAHREHVAPQYDGSFQTQYAHHSATHGPHEMREAVLSILGALEGAGTIDYFEMSPFEFAGRTFAKNADCEFALKVYSDPSSESVVELRRTCGECFEYATVESTLLRELMARGAITDEDDDSDMAEDSDSEAFGFGFGTLPPLDAMQLDCDVDDENKSELDQDTATQMLLDAVDLASSTRNIIRSDIAQLNECMDRHIDTFKCVPDIVSTIAGALNGKLFDCWAIKTYLDILCKLIAAGTAVPPSLGASIGALQTRWQQMVVNQVAPGVGFEFFPSQQIVRGCEKVMKLLNTAQIE